MSTKLRSIGRTLVCCLLASAAARPARAQTSGGPEVIADAGIARGGGVSGAPPGAGSGGSTASTDWFAGAALASPRLEMGRSWDFSVAAGLSREPVLGMARVPNCIMPAYLDAVRASFWLYFVHTSGPFDVAIVGRYAETRVDSSQAVTPVENDNGPWTFLWEATAHLRWYASRDTNAPTAQRRLMPIVDIYGGIKHDRQFHRGGDLEPYDDPTGRLLGGVFVAAWRWRDRNGVPAIVVGAGGDFETALRTGVRLPSAGRIFVRANVDVRRLAAPSR